MYRQAGSGVKLNGQRALLRALPMLPFTASHYSPTI